MFPKTARKNTHKPNARPKRRTRSLGDHSQELWVNVDFFRKLTTRDSRMVAHGQAGEAQNRYLELADLVLNGKAKKKTR